MDDKEQNKRIADDEAETVIHRLTDSDGETMDTNDAASSALVAAELERVKAELEKSRKEHLYLAAEFDTYKRNVIKERSDLRKYGSERLIVDLLNVLDIFETALKIPAVPENSDSFRKGIELTANELRSVLSRHGVEELPAEGKPFDPMIHEAISSEETDALPAGHISRAFKKPFKLHDRVIRPGQVVVAKAKSS